MKIKLFIIIISLFCCNITIGCDHLRIVGSSSVYFFIAIAAEKFTRLNNQCAPIVESTGTGAGISLFCTAKSSMPHMVMTSRAFTKSEIKLCALNNINNIKKIKLGLDGIVLVSSSKRPAYNLSLEELFWALDKEGEKPLNWRSAKNNKIMIYGPAASSGTRADFAEIVMKGHLIREDEAFTAMGNNANLIIQKLNSNTKAIGIIGYNFLEHNLNKVHAASINNVFPTYQNIASGKYPLSRTLYIYVNADLLKKSQYLEQFIDHIILARKTYMLDYGLIPFTQIQ